MAHPARPPQAGQVIDARVLAHTVVERLSLGYNAGRGGAEAMIVPMVDGAIRAESEEVIPDNRNFARAQPEYAACR